MVGDIGRMRGNQVRMLGQERLNTKLYHNGHFRTWPRCRRIISPMGHIKTS